MEWILRVKGKDEEKVIDKIANFLDTLKIEKNLQFEVEFEEN